MEADGRSPVMTSLFGKQRRCGVWKPTLQNIPLSLRGVFGSGRLGHFHCGLRGPALGVHDLLGRHAVHDRIAQLGGSNTPDWRPMWTIGSGYGILRHAPAFAIHPGQPQLRQGIATFSACSDGFSRRPRRMPESAQHEDEKRDRQ